MTFCAICGLVSSNNFKRDILLDKIGEPPVLMSEILVKITIDIEHQFTSTEACDECTNKIARYYEAIQTAEQIKQEIMGFLHKETTVECLYDSEEECLESIESTEIICPIELEDEEIKAEALEVIPNLENRVENVIQKTQKCRIKSQIKLTDQDENVNEVKTACEAIKTENSRTAETEIEKLDAKENTDVETKKESFDCAGSKGISMYHSSGIGQPIGIQCEICDRVFKYARTFHAHKKYRDFVGYICEICGIQCLTKAGMKDHAKVHKPDKEFQCPHCDAQFHRKFLLNQHMAYHTNETPFQCEICAKCFVHRVALNVHKKIHTEYIRRFDCKLCDKKFRSVTHLRRHMAIHTGAKPFMCPICNNRFSQAYNMKAHMKLHTDPNASIKRKTSKKANQESIQ